ncbi:MAG TPA: toll/interleukin-1 receptor domain-containing protein [Pyrinomonadaceae bacterium]
MAIVQLKLGDMFDGPSDLIVLPCSISGTITEFVRKSLIHHRIPYPESGMKLGDVSVMPFQGGENIAQFVAYAASVAYNNSSIDAVRRIGEQLGEATNQNPTIRLVSAPLLGAGAGGLKSEEVVESLTKGFKSTAHRDARLVIHVRHQNVFSYLSMSSVPSIPEQKQAPEPVSPLRVFISYSHTSAEHEQWVEKLGIFLRESGIDARLDIWNLRHGMDLPQFMTNELALAERVILISDEKYAEKADGRVGGVGWETMIVQGDIANQPPDSTKYLVIVRSKNIEEGLPRYLKTRFVIHWSEDTYDGKNKDILLRELYDQVKAPPLGQKPVFL